MGVIVSNSSNYVDANKQFSTFVGAIAPLAPMLTHANPLLQRPNTKTINLLDELILEWR